MSTFGLFFNLLRRQEEEYRSIVNSAPLKDHFLSLKQGVGLLQSFYRLSGRDDIYWRFETILEDVRGDFESLQDRAIDDSLILDMDRACTNLRGKIKNVFINPETGEYDATLSPEKGNYHRDIFRFVKRLSNGFGDLLRCKDDQIAPSMKEKLLVLQTFFTYLRDVKSASSVGPEMLAALTEKTACFLYSCLVGKMDEEIELEMKRNPSYPLEKNFVKEAYLMIFRDSTSLGSPEDLRQSELLLLHSLIKILESRTSFQIYLKDQNIKLYHKLNFLAELLKDLPRGVIVEKFKYVVRPSTEAIISRVIPILYSWYEEEMKEAMALEVNGAVFEVLDQIEHIQFELRSEMKLYYHYPKTDELGFLDLLLEHLEELLKCRPELIEVLKNQIETLNEEFDFLRSFLRKIKKQHNEHEELEDLWTCIIGLAYQTEYIIDFFLLNDDPDDSRIMLSLSKVIEQTTFVKSKVKRIYDEEKYDKETHDIVKSFSHLHSKATDTTTTEFVGFEDEEEKMMQYLVGGSTQRDVISVIGMPGLGKTTLAKKLYEAPSIIKHFDIRAWCSVSQAYQGKQMLLTILGNAVGDTHGINNLDDEDLDEKLYKSLKGRRYLIILDDIWDIEAWNHLVSSFPDDKTQSRILITSRLESVALQIKGCCVHFLRQFSDDESWDLFQKKLFLKERFPRELLDVGKEIVESCNRLPLAIVVVAGLLTKLEKSTHMWEQIAKSLSSHIFSDSENQCKSMLELSYIHLPDHLKSCFLYIGAFTEDESIIVSKLKSLWIAEGFVRNNLGKSLDDVAEEYFKDLISRSLLTATQERSQGGIKTCQVHDLLLEFCLEKAKEEKFLHVRDGYFSDTGDDLPVVYVQRRISSSYNLWELEDGNHPPSYSLRSLLYFHDYHSEVSFISQNFRLLRVLHIEIPQMDDNFSGIELLIHLRYLFLGDQIAFIPPSITNLWNLQFLLLGMMYEDDDEPSVPDSLWDMVNLRHVHINDRASFNVDSGRLEKSSLLDNLETLSTPCFSCKEDAENLLRRLPKLRKLSCVFLDCCQDSIDCCQFPVLDFLDQLMSLKVHFKGSLHLGKRCEFKFPSNLQKLTLRNSRITWDDISRIVNTLPNLKVLKLIGNYTSEEEDSTWNKDEEDRTWNEDEEDSNEDEEDSNEDEKDSNEDEEYRTWNENEEDSNEDEEDGNEDEEDSNEDEKDSNEDEEDRTWNENEEVSNEDEKDSNEDEEDRTWNENEKDRNEDEEDRTWNENEEDSNGDEEDSNEDSTWNVNDEDFPQLKYLKLSCLRNLRNWIASEESFPKLEQLVLEECDDLDEIPPRFEDIPTLRKIVVIGCDSSVNDSARRIQEEQQDGWQNQELKVVYIKPKRRGAIRRLGRGS